MIYIPEIKVPEGSLRAIDRLKILKSIDHDKKILPQKSTAYHLALLDYLTATMRGVVCAYRGFGKSTTTLGHFLPTEGLSSERDLCILINTNSQAKSQDWIKTIRLVFERFIQYGLKCEKGDMWGNSGVHFINENEKSIILAPMSPQKDIRGTNKYFERPTHIICDDLETNSPNASINARTAQGRQKMRSYFFSELLPSLSSESKLIVVGTILHKDGLIAQLLRDTTFHSFILPAIVDGKSAWPSKFPLENSDIPKELSDKVESIETIKKRLYEKGMHDHFYREYMCEPASSQSKIFSSNMFSYFDGLVYDEEVEHIEIKDNLNKNTISVRRPTGMKINGLIIPLNSKEVKVFLCIDNASDGGDAHAMVVAASYAGRIYVLEVAGGVKMTPFDKSCELLRLLLEYRCDYGSEKGGMQNDYFYINRNTILNYQEHFQKRNFFPQSNELKPHGKAKAVRIAQLQIPMREGRIIFNRQCPNMTILESQLLDFVIDEDGRDDYIDALAYFLQVFGFVSFEYQKSNEVDISINSLFL